MRFGELIEAFVASHDLDPVEANGDGSCDFTFDDQLTVTFEPVGRSTVYLVSRLDGLPADRDDADAQLRDAMRFNLALQRDHAGSLAVDAEGRALVLYREVKIDAIGIDRFNDIVGAFVDNVDAWRRDVREAPRPAPMMQMLFP